MMISRRDVIWWVWWRRGRGVGGVWRCIWSLCWFCIVRVRCVYIILLSIVGRCMMFKVCKGSGKCCLCCWRVGFGVSWGFLVWILCCLWWSWGLVFKCKLDWRKSLIYLWYFFFWWLGNILDKFVYSYILFVVN